MTVDDLLRQIMTPARRRAVKSVAGKGGLVTGLAGLVGRDDALHPCAPAKGYSPTVVVGTTSTMQAISTSTSRRIAGEDVPW